VPNFPIYREAQGDNIRSRRFESAFAVDQRLEVLLKGSHYICAEEKKGRTSLGTMMQVHVADHEEVISTTLDIESIFQHTLTDLGTTHVTRYKILTTEQALCLTAAPASSSYKASLRSNSNVATHTPSVNTRWSLKNYNPSAPVNVKLELYYVASKVKL
jgi:hypothetical protein